MIITEKYLPTPEVQRRKYTLEDQTFIFDSLGCVAEGGTNNCEFLGNKKNDQYNIYFLNQNYLDEKNKINFSGREVAKRSDTTKKGNTGPKVADAISKGMVAESTWPWPEPGQDQKVTWDEYYSPFPEKVEEQRNEYKKRYENPWKWVKKDNFTKVFEKDKPLLGFVYAWVRNDNKYNGLYYMPKGKSTNHAIMIIGAKFDEKGNLFCWIVFDTYEPFIKEVHPNNMYGWAIEFDFIIKNNLMDVQQFIKENEGNILRNKKTGAYGVIYDGEVLHVSEERAGLFVLDREARGVLGEAEKVEVEDEFWQEELKPKEF